MAAHARRVKAWRRREMRQNAKNAASIVPPPQETVGSSGAVVLPPPVSEAKVWILAFIATVLK